VKRQLNGKLEKITTFLLEKKIVGTPQQRFEKATTMYDAAEDALDGFSARSPKGHGVQKDSHRSRPAGEDSTRTTAILPSSTSRSIAP
jgi:hypothetical protein